jgi:hypothetical protein
LWFPPNPAEDGKLIPKMNSRKFAPRGKDSFLDRLLEVAKVAIGSLLFCSVSIVGVAAVAWVILVAFDAHRSAIADAVLVARYARIPFGVAAGLAIFFAAVSWESARIRPNGFEESVDRRLAAIERRLGIQREREIS